MTDIKKAFAEKQFPTFIKNHSIFKDFKEIKKVFPEIGLPNCEKEITVDNGIVVKNAADSCIFEIKCIIENRINSLTKFSKSKTEMGKERKSKIDNCIKLLSSTKEICRTRPKQFIISTNGKITLNLPSDILDVDNKVVFKAGEGLFRSYNKLNEMLRACKSLPMTKFENLQSFKHFSSINIPAVNHTIRFSSNGSEGLWDIATMSMRGFTSCQTWGNTNSTHIVGSIADPFTGIIYLTSGSKFNEHGSKMIRRCVVRFMVNKKTKTPYIGLEKMYPAGDNVMLNEFIKFIKERTDNKFDVHYLQTKPYSYDYVPMSKIVSNLSAYDQPYRDSGIVYETDVNDEMGLLRKALEEKISTISRMFGTKTISALKTIKLQSVIENSKKGFTALRGYDCSYYLNNDITNAINKYLLSFIMNDKNLTDKNTSLKTMLSNLTDIN